MHASTDELAGDVSRSDAGDIDPESGKSGAEDDKEEAVSETAYDSEARYRCEEDFSETCWWSEEPDESEWIGDEVVALLCRCVSGENPEPKCEGVRAIGEAETGVRPEDVGDEEDVCVEGLCKDNGNIRDI